MSRNIMRFTLAALLLSASYGCIQTKHEVEVKPMHITIDVNVRVQEDLKEKFSKTDQQYKEISDKEAEEALSRYLEKENK